MGSPIRITHLSHVALRVPDPAEASAFYQRVLGLGETFREPRTGAVGLSTLPGDYPTVSHHEVILYPGATGLDHIALAVADEGALQAAAAALRERGIAVDGPARHEPAHGPSVRFADPDGRVVELLVQSPPVPRPPGRPGFDLVKLGHVTMKSPDPDRARRFWEETLGFRLSDQMGEIFFWLRCNRDHHSVAFMKGERPAVHHVALELPGWDQVRAMGDHFIREDVRFEFGPGRHGPGNNIFVYFLDPYRIRWELFCDLVRIDDEENYRPGYWEAGDRGKTVNRWGGSQPPPSYFEV